MTEESKRDNKEEKFSRVEKCLIALIVILVIVFIVFICMSINNQYALAVNKNDIIDIPMTGALGSLLGGVLSPLVSILAVIFYYHALRLQRRDIKLQRDALDKQKKELETLNKSLKIQSSYTSLQEWITEFYTLLKLYRQSLSVGFINYYFKIDRDIIGAKSSLDKSVYKWLELHNIINTETFNKPLKGQGNGLIVGQTLNYNLKNIFYSSYSEVVKGNECLADISLHNNNKLSLANEYFKLICEHMEKNKRLKEGKLKAYLIQVARITSYDLIDYYIEICGIKSSYAFSEVLKLVPDYFHIDYLASE